MKLAVSRFALILCPVLMLSGCAHPVKDLVMQAAARCRAAGGSYSVNLQQYSAEQANGIIVGSCSSRDPIAVAVR
ncbi:MAG: hypothetical protein KGO48_00775 [Alphaproteobacteria bacterium]|nr:hypothetical protein [Alphaproteobacteria bacterium]